MSTRLTPHSCVRLPIRCQSNGAASAVIIAKIWRRHYLTVNPSNQLGETWINWATTWHVFTANGTSKQMNRTVIGRSPRLLHLCHKCQLVLWVHVAAGVWAITVLRQNIIYGSGGINTKTPVSRPDRHQREHSSRQQELSLFYLFFFTLILQNVPNSCFYDTVRSVRYCPACCWTGSMLPTLYLLLMSWIKRFAVNK